MIEIAEWTLPLTAMCDTPYHRQRKNKDVNPHYQMQFVSVYNVSLEYFPIASM